MTPTFPSIVEEVVGASSAPSCTICHATPTGGLGTATKPFALFLRSRGLVANDEDSLRNALAAATGERHDTDGDGVLDVDQLRAGIDPNGAQAATEGPQYGCSLTPAATYEPVLVLLVLAAVLRRARRGA